MKVAFPWPLDSYHFGGDEAKNIFLGSGYSSIPENLKQLPFSQSPVCKAKIKSDSFLLWHSSADYQLLGVQGEFNPLAQNGVRDMLAWEDRLRGTSIGEQQMDLHLLPLADDGIDIIVSNPDYLYFDFPYEVNSEERGYYWGARFNSVYNVFSFAPENLPHILQKRQQTKMAMRCSLWL